jgi:hypothetical protein
LKIFSGVFITTSSQNTKYIAIGGAAAAVAVIVGVLSMTGVFVDADDTSIQDELTEPMPQEISPQEKTPVGPQTSENQQPQLQEFRINESCELLYAMTVGEYPNGERLQSLSITGIVAKYQNDFQPWLEIFMDEEKTREFVTQGFSPEFLQLFSLAVMQEYAINPELQPLVYAALDPNSGDAQINTLFNEDGCTEYFTLRQGQ